jgi:hypothetical protein
MAHLGAQELPWPRREQPLGGERGTTEKVLRQEAAELLGQLAGDEGGPADVGDPRSLGAANLM